LATPANLAAKLLALLYWQIGDRIRRDILGEAWAEYGSQIISTLSRQLTA